MVSPVGAGTARNLIGRINIDTSQAMRSIQSFSRAASQELGKVGAGLSQSLQRNLGTFRIDQQLGSIKRFSESFEPLHSAVGEARVQLLGVTAAAAGFVVAGLRAADTVNILTIRYRELAGGAAEGERLMNRVGRAAEALNQPVLTAQKNFIGLIPAVREVNGDLEQYVNLSARLSTLNQDARGGLEGAIYAIREALSSGNTDLVSLSERFNIPRKALRAAIEETGNFADALDQILDRYGATTEAVQAQARSLSVLGQRLADVGQRLLARVFAGALETVRSALEGLIDALNRVPDWLVGVGGSALLAVGGLTALVLVVDALASSYTRVATVALTFARYMQTQVIPAMLRATVATRAWIVANQAALVRGGVTVGALAAGTALGVGAVNLAGRIGQRVAPGATADRFSKFTLDNALETLKQALFLLINVIIDAFEPLADVLTVVIWNFNNLQKIVQSFGIIMQIVATNIQIAIQEFLIRIGQGSQEELDRLMRVRGERFFENGTDGQFRQVAASGLLGELDTLAQEAAASLGEALVSTDDLFRNIKLGIYDAFYPAQELLEETENAFVKLIHSIQDNLDQIGAGIGDEFASRADSELAFYRELADLFESGDTDAIESRLRGLELEREAIEALLPELEKHAEYSNDAAEKLEEYNGRLEEISAQLPRFVDALDAAVRRGLDEASNEYADAVKKATDDRDKALADAQKKTNKKLIDLDKEIGKDQVNLRKEELDIRDKYNDAILKAEDQFRKRLADIQRSYILAVSLAASMIDAAGVAAAINDRIEQTAKAGQDKSEAAKSADEQRQDRRKDLAEEAADKRAAYEEQRQDLIDDFNERKQELIDQFIEERGVAQTARDQEITEIQNYYAQRRSDLAIYQQEELAMQQRHHFELLLRYAQAFSPVTQAIGGAIDFIGNLLQGAPQNQGTILSSGAFGAPTGGGIGYVQFNITSPHDPQQVAQTVNRHLINLANGRTITE